MDELIIREYYRSALYALALGAPRDVVEFSQESHALEDNFEAAEGFKRALEDTKGMKFNCKLKLPEGFELNMYPDNEQTGWDTYDDYED